MLYRTLGRTGLAVSIVGLGAGPVPALMTGDDPAMQREVVAVALKAGINWFDTAPGYGDGKSEACLGQALADLGGAAVHLATKVRLAPADLRDPVGAIRRSMEASLVRLRVAHVALLQLHNGITSRQGEIAASLSVDDVLNVVIPALLRVRDEGLTRFIGLTGTGDPTALKAVIASSEIDTVQIPHHILAPADADLLQLCQERRVGVFAIRVFAGGALLDLPPSAHTLKTPYFPLALYEDDRRRASVLQERFGREINLKEAALRFALTQPPDVALVGFSEPSHVLEAAALAERGPLSAEWLRWLKKL